VYGFVRCAILRLSTIPKETKKMEDIINYLTAVELFDNTLLAWLLGLLVTLIALVVLLFLRLLMGFRLASYSEKNGVKMGVSVARLIQQTNFVFILVLAFYLGSLFITLPLSLASLLRVIVIVVLLVQVGLWASNLLSIFIVRRKEERLADESGSVTTLNAVELIAKIGIWTLVLLLALDNIPGIQVTALLASLGVGGIAVGLAVQNILADLFASLSIALDKPFVIGDFINVGEFSGTVEYIGLKSTRLRSISGEQVVFSNSDLLASRIRNFKRMARRRIVFPIQVTYQTPIEKLRAIPQLIREVIDAQENATFDRAHFKSFGESSLEFEAVFFMEIPDYMVYMDTQQAVNLCIFEAFSREGIEFAFPTHTVFLENSPS
jgi:small-conductance mechanosensitive channel